LAHTSLLVSSKVQDEIWPVAPDRNDTVLSHLVLRQTSAAHVLTTKLLEVPMTLSRLLFGIVVLSLSVLSAARDTQAKDQLRLQRGANAGSNSAVFKNARRLTSTETGRRLHGNWLSKREFEKLIKSAVRKCGCTAATQDTEFSGSCFQSCVARYVGWPTVLACGTVCFGGNAPGCAFCLGAHEWVVLGCVQYCVWRNVFRASEGPESRNRATPSKRQPKSLFRSPGSASSS
jgi:hypothetical protein